MDVAKKTEYFIFKGLASLVLALPLSAVRIMAKGIAWLAFHVLRIRRTMTEMQIRRAMPEKTEAEIVAIAYGSYINLVTTICELLWAPNITSDTCSRYIVHENIDVLMDAYKRGRGVIFISGHFGNWEWLGGSLALDYRLPTAVIVRPMQNQYVDTLIEGIRENANVRVITMQRAVREVLSFLRTGGVVVILGDQSASRESCFVPFFGIPAATFAGAAQFALKTGAPIVMGYGVRQGDGTYHASYEEIPSDDLGELNGENIETLTVRHVQALERMIRKHPEQWLWQHKRWKHAPVSEERMSGLHPSNP
jgi:Kdo2-lipid IVA lauroyltransferase/acyltransferase